MNPYFSLSDKVFDVVEHYPEVLDLLIANGLDKLANETMLKTMGKTISLEMALKSRNFDVEAFEEKMVAVIEENRSSDLMDSEDSDKDVDIKISGVLPCPVRLQLLEKLDQWIENYDGKVSYELQAASMGLEWLEGQFKDGNNENNLADIYLSAGFSLFFDNEIMGKYLDKNIFSDLTHAKRLNKVFDNESIDLKDPKGIYSIIGVVPAIFMVNTNLLDGRKFPETWEDLLSPEFENTIALPIQDLDLFNAVLLTIYKNYGEEGVRSLGRNAMVSMHPAQMVKLGNKNKKSSAPIVTVMPDFFSWMAKEGSPVKTVWPKDGSIISPIFLITKNKNKEKIQPLVDFLSSKDMGNVLSADGKFPSTHYDVENELSEDQKFMWMGWDFIYNNDIGALLRETERIFYDELGR